MTIDQAKRFVEYVMNKDQRGGLTPSRFNLLAGQAQIEVVSGRLGNVKKLDGRLLPPSGYKSNRKIQNELRQLLVGPSTQTISSGVIPYPDDYFYIDALHTDDYIPITVLDSDEYPYHKQSVIHPPDADHPVAVFYGQTILIDPTSIQVKMSYIRYPLAPNWDYNIQSQVEIYNDTETPGQTGAISKDFEVDASLHIDICRTILKYCGVNLADSMVTEFAKMEEQMGA